MASTPGNFLGEYDPMIGDTGEPQPGDWDYAWQPSAEDRAAVAAARQNLDPARFGDEALDALDVDQLTGEAERLLFETTGPGSPGPDDAFSAMINPAILMREPGRAEQAAQFSALAAAIARRVLQQEVEGA